MKLNPSFSILVVIAITFITLTPDRWLESKSRDVAQSPSRKPKGAVTKRTDYPDLIVTANRRIEPASSSTHVTTVIPREEIERKNIPTLAEALVGKPGAFISTAGTPGQQTSLFTRGTESNHTALLINGRRLNPNLDSSYDLTALALDNAERIEILRSPAATLYGADTIGGVVNIITRDGKGLTKPEYWVKTEAGSFHTFKNSVGTRGQLKFFDYSLEAHRLDAEYTRDNNQTRQTTARGLLGFQIARDHALNLHADYNLLDTGIPGNRFFPTPDRSNLLRETWSIVPEWKWQTLENWVQSLAVGHSRSRQAVIDTFSHNRTQYNFWQLDYRSELAWDKVDFVAGFQASDAEIYRFNAFTENRDIENNQSQVGVYAQLSWEITPRLNFSQSLRYDHYSDFPEAWTHRTGLSFRVPKTETLLRASYGRAYSPPTAQDLYFPFFSNPFLRSEKSEGWEIGLEQEFFNNKLHAQATYFYNRITDLIQFSSISFRPENIGLATTEGLEFALRWTPIQEFELHLHYTYLTAQDKPAARRLLRRPRHQGGLTIVAKPHKNWDLSTEILAVWDREDIHAGNFSRIDGENYWTWNAAISYQVHQHLRLFARAENILDQKYEVVHGYPALARGFYAGVKFSY